MTTRKTKKKWSAKVTTDSTHPDQGLFNQSASAIAKALASKKVSPKGPASGMRMLNFYINRAGKNLSNISPRRTRKSQDQTLRNHRKQKRRPQSAKKTLKEIRTKKAPTKSLSKKSSAK